MDRARHLDQLRAEAALLVAQIDRIRLEYEAPRPTRRAVREAIENARLTAAAIRVRALGDYLE